MSLEDRDRLIVALDVSSPDEARSLVDRLGETVSFYKVGYQLCYSGGLPLVRELADQGKKVFVDLKLHDIPNTVEKGAAALARLGARFLTVHAYRPTLAAAVAGRADTDLKILGVTILTSWDDHDVVDAGYSEPLTEMVRRRAIDTGEAGADGVIIAAREAPLVRAALGPDLLIVTPGIRPHGSAVGDQKRAVTPAEAIAAGVDHMVVGRPITAADDPAAAARAIQDEIAEALQML
jgi:orotidine-5'-phosphate decarboxylase